MNPDCEKGTFMRGLIWAFFIGLAPAAAHAMDRPDWAFPVADKVQPAAKDDTQLKTLPGSANLARKNKSTSGMCTMRWLGR
jgi:hypothetical protein